MNRNKRMLGWFAALTATAAFVLSAEPPHATDNGVVKPVVRQHAESLTPVAGDATDVKATLVPERPKWGALLANVFASDDQLPAESAGQTLQTKSFVPEPIPPQVTPPLPVVMPSASQPEFPFRALGQLEQESGRVVFLLGSDGPQIAKVGTPLPGGWVVDSMTDSALKVQHAETHQLLTVPLPVAR